MVTNHAPQTKYCRNIIADNRALTDPSAPLMGAFSP